MYSTGLQFASLMALPSRTLSARGLITYPDTSTDSLTSAEIVSLVVHENAGEHLPLGGVSASTLTLRLDNRQGEWNSKDFDGAIINLEIGVYNPNYSATPLTVDGDSPSTVYTESADGGAPDTVYTDTIDGGAPETFPAETYWAKIGTYVTESAIGQEQSTTIEIKGADFLGNYAQKTFTDGQTYPRTVLQILQYVCTQSGITLDTTTFINSAVSITTKPAWEENTTCRDIIGFIACLACGFARIDRDGLLEIVAFDDNPDYSITTARYKNFERQGAIFGPFNALSVYEFGAPNNYGATRIADDIDMVDNELNSIAVQGNPLLKYGSSSTLMTNMLNGLLGLTFTGAKIDWQGDPSLTNGDAVTLTDLDAASVVVLILDQTLTLDSGFAMSSGNSLKSVIKGKAKAEYMRVFTPTGKLNAAALDGDINIRAGRQLNLLAGGDIHIEMGGLFDVASGKFIIDTDGNVEMEGKITALTGLIGDFTLSNGHLVHSNSGTHEFVDLSKWGLAIGEDASPPNYHFPFSVSSVFDADFGHMRCTYGRLGALDFAPDAVIIKTTNTVYSGTREAKITLDPVTSIVTAYGGFICKSPDGTAYKITVANGGGSVTITAV